MQGHFREKESKKGERPAWNFFAPQQNSNKVSLNAESEGRSCYLLHLAKQEHVQPIASVKSAASPFWGTSAGTAATRHVAGPTPTPQAACDSPGPGDAHSSQGVSVCHRVKTPGMDLLSAAERRAWEAQTLAQASAARRNERGLARRRVADRSQATLDNAYRQYVPQGSDKPLMFDIMRGSFMENGSKRLRPRTDYISLNRQQVRSASAVVHQCKRQGMFQ